MVWLAAQILQQEQALASGQVQFFLQALVHSAGGVRKNPVAENSLSQARDVAFAVVAVHGHQNQQATANLGDFLLIDDHVGAGDPL